MEARKILIVESDIEASSQMAEALKAANFQVTQAQSIDDAERELEAGHADLVILRAEMPGQSGFQLTARWKKRYPKTLILLASSTSSPDVLDAHRASQGAAHSYVALPIQPKALASLVEKMFAILGDASPEEAPLSERTKKSSPPSLPPSLLSRPPRPPPMPVRSRRPSEAQPSALSPDELETVRAIFATVSDRRAELLRDTSEPPRRAASRRSSLATPEGKVEALRDELRQREVQIARLSEIWASVEKEQQGWEGRLQEKDAVIEDARRQIEDLKARVLQARQAMRESDQRHSAAMDEMMLRQREEEKNLMEVVSGKEKALLGVKRELSKREEDLRALALQLEKSERSVSSLKKSAEEAAREVGRREAEIREAGRALEYRCLVHVREEDEAAELIERIAGERAALSEELSAQKNVQKSAERQAARTEGVLALRLRQAEADFEANDLGLRLWAAHQTCLAKEARDDAAVLLDALLEAEEEIHELGERAEALRIQRDGQNQAWKARLKEKDAALEESRSHIADVEGELEARSLLQDALKGEIAEKQAQLAQQKAHAEETERLLQAEKARASAGEAEAASLAQKLSALEAESSNLSEEVRALSDDLDGRDIRIQELAGDLEAREAELGNVKGELAALSEAHAQVQAALESESKERARENAQWQEELEAAEDARAAMESSLQRELSEKRSEVQALNLRAAELGEKCASKDARISELSAQNDDLSASLKAAKGALSARDDQIQSLEAQLTEGAGALLAAAEREASLKAQAASLERSRASFADELAAEREALAEAERELEAQKLKAEEREASLGEMAESLAQEKAKTASLEARNAENTEALQRLRDALAEREIRLSALQKEMENASEAWTLQTENFEAALGQAHSEIEAVHAELCERSEALAAAEAEIRSLESEMKSASESSGRQISALSEKLSLTEARLHETEDALLGAREELRNVRDAAAQREEKLQAAHSHEMAEAEASWRTQVDRFQSSLQEWASGVRKAEMALRRLGDAAERQTTLTVMLPQPPGSANTAAGSEPGAADDAAERAAAQIQAAREGEKDAAQEVKSSGEDVFSQEEPTPFGDFGPVQEDDEPDADSCTVVTVLPGFFPPPPQAGSADSSASSAAEADKDAPSWLSDAFDKLDGLG